MVSFHDFDNRSMETRFLAKGINHNPLISWCEDLSHVNLVSQDLSLHTSYRFFSSDWTQMLQKADFSNISLNLIILLIPCNLYKFTNKKSPLSILIPIYRWKIKISAILNTKICFPQSCDRQTDKQAFMRSYTQLKFRINCYIQFFSTNFLLFSKIILSQIFNSTYSR